MRLSLTPHPDTPCTALDRVEVEASRRGKRLSLAFYCYGDPAQLKGLPAKAGLQIGERVDELWRSTCFEIFLKESRDTAYTEMNFSPTGHWAAYMFEDYRQGMCNATMDSPRIAATIRDNCFILSIVVEQPIEFAPLSTFNCAITAVFETQDGAISYWSLKHPDGPADFHDSIGFDHKLTY